VKRREFIALVGGTAAWPFGAGAQTKFEFIVNYRTAALLGIAVPASILLRADEVIE